jgi:tRNA A37 methylthiotransferase MiaB
LDAVGVFGYSDEDGTEAARLPGKVRRDTIARRVSRLTDLVDELVAQRAEERVGSIVDVLVESVDGGVVEGRAEHQAPEVDGTTTLRSFVGAEVGDIVTARVVATEGVDLVGEPVAR